MALIAISSLAISANPARSLCPVVKAQGDHVSPLECALFVMGRTLSEVAEGKAIALSATIAKKHFP